MLIRGFELCARHHDIPHAELLGFIDELRELGYRNEWVHTARRKGSVSASLHCRMDEERFTLSVRLTRGGQTILARELLTTKPDETIFAYQFKKISFEGDRLVITNEFDKPAFEVDLTALPS